MKTYSWRNINTVFHTKTGVFTAPDAHCACISQLYMHKRASYNQQISQHNTQRDRQTDRDRETETDRQTAKTQRLTETASERERLRQTDRQTQTQTETERGTERERKEVLDFIVSLSNIQTSFTASSKHNFTKSVRSQNQLLDYVTVLDT